MKKITIEGARGLLTSARRTELGQKGYFTSCDNILIRNDGVIEPRFGLEQLGSSAASTVDRVFYDSKNKQILRTTPASTLLEKYNGTAWATLDSTRYYSDTVQSRSFQYLLANDGLRRINVGNTSTEIGFVPEGLDVQLVSLSGSSGWMANNKQVGYRVVFGLKNTNNEFFLGAPSGRMIVINNSGGTRDTQLRFTLPTEITTSHFFQVYRTQVSSGVSIDPGDEMYLIYENYPTSTDISNKYVTFTDTVPSGNGGAALYTNQGQQGDDQANFRLECATDTSIYLGGLEIFADCLWAHNYQPRSNMTLNLLAVLTDNGLNARSFTASTTSGSPTLSSVSSFTGIVNGMALFGSGIPAGTTISGFNSGAGTITMSQNATATAAGVTVVAGDTIVIGGETFYAHTTETINSNQFAVSTNASAATAVRETTESLIRVINRSTGSTRFYARYLSGPDQLPGRFQLSARTDRASSYTIQCSQHGQAFSPNITTAQTILSKNDRGLLTFSKPNEPQSWPLFNTIKIAGDATIYGIAALRAALLVGTDKGLYRVTGTYGNFVLDLIDQSTIMSVSSNGFSPGMVVLDNKAYFLSTKGLIEATEATTKIVSGNVSTHFNNPTVSDSRYLSVHEGDNLVFVPFSYGTFCYNAKNQTWVSFSTPWNTGVYDRSTLRMVLNNTTNTQRSRDATYQAENLYDRVQAVNINSISGNTLTLDGSYVVSAGDIITQSDDVIILGVSGTNIEVEDGTAFTTGPAEITVGYTCSVVYCPVADGMGSTKHFRSGNVFFDGAALESTSLSSFNNTQLQKRVTFTIATDQQPNSKSTSGVIDSQNYPFMYHFWIPKDGQRGAIVVPGFSVRCTANAFRVNGIDVDYEEVSERTRR